ncbi:hypothetical protein PROVRETT_09543 [Providencia rettgeri DSM 1131]|uniref:hypothetical protein n=1 Tax=Providencia rettgeri TaxID=587 RepID=UPI000197CA5F|nr:hypothetical protein [Providencia rettgeri]EFE51814.1 hypothetical protein PROVRETT_09543 [Providencia rettgeri DSM 1131]MCG9527948.1 hypothetical protein [Providencia rettgeri]QKG43876.1 hypothetical protein HRD55_04395 [Providencia rettgeri]QNN34005.1 hypothetical protein H9X60_04395 [Providencia rettgeri]QXA58915.1 hypothetical protein I6L79_05035 [Providencia rettgeri]
MDVKEYIPEHYLQSVNEGDSRLFELDDNGFSNYGGPSFTIFVSPPDSQYIDVVGDNTNIGDSSFGHVFIGLKGTNPESNQFESVSIGFSAGNSFLTNTDNISFDDHNKYSEASSLTIVGQGPVFNNDLNNNGVETLPYDFGVLFKFNGELKKNGWVSPSDALLIMDKNSDGKTQFEELLGLSKAGISSISLSYSFSDYVDGNSNQHKLISEVTWIDGKKTDIVDVWFKQKDIAHPENQLAELISLFNSESSISLNNVLMTTMKNTLPFLKSNNNRVFNGLI